MPHEIDANYDQQYLFPPSLEDLLAPDDPARFIRAFVEELDLDALGLKPPCTTVGRPRYSNRLLLKMYLYCQLHRLKSFRDKQRACHRDIGLLWLLGMNYPDHNTIWRFEKENGPLLKELLKQIIGIALKGGLVGLVLNAIDGTKIQADVAAEKGYSKRLITRLLQNIDAITDTLTAEQEDATAAPEYVMPQELSDPTHLRKVVQSLIAAEKKGTQVSLSSDEKKTSRPS